MPQSIKDTVIINGGGDVVSVLFEIVCGVTHSYAYSGLQNHGK